MTTPVVTELVNGRNRYVVNVTGVFDTSDASNVVIIDRSELTGPDGSVPGKIRIDEITWAVGPDFDYVELKYDEAGGDLVIDYFSGAGYMDYRPYGGKHPPAVPAVATDGDIQLSTAGGATGGTFSLLLSCRLG